MSDHLITQEQLDQLRQIAENATPGPWIQKGVKVFGPREPWDLGTGPARIMAAQMPWMRERMEANAAHAAAFDPPTVLALLDRIKYLEEQARRNYQDWQAAYARAEAADAVVQRVQDAIRDAPTSDPTSGRTGPPDDWPDDGELIGQGEFLVAEQVRRALGAASGPRGADQQATDYGPICCNGDCCGPGSYCCGHPDNKHTHAEARDYHIVAYDNPTTCVRCGKHLDDDDNTSCEAPQ